MFGRPTKKHTPKKKKNPEQVETWGKSPLGERLYLYSRKKKIKGRGERLITKRQFSPSISNITTDLGGEENRTIR